MMGKDQIIAALVQSIQRFRRNIANRQTQIHQTLNKYLFKHYFAISLYIS